MNHLEIIQEVFGKDEYVNDVWLDNMLTLCRRVAEEERKALYKNDVSKAIENLKMPFSQGGWQHD